MTILNRLREATTGSRDLDAAIYCHVEECEFVSFVSDFEDDFIKVKRSGFKYVRDEIFPAYTTSIDAALALVERMLPRYRVLLGIDECGSATCSLGIRREVWGATPALAILTAMFTALEKENVK